MAHFFNAAEHGQISREDWIRVAHKHGVPCFNDAAADVPPISNLWNYTQMGFDLVTFSGGKGIRGPQNAGLLLGRKDLIAAAVMNNNPFDDCVGRGMKVAKEQIVGMVAAVDWFLSQSDDRDAGGIPAARGPDRRPPERSSHARNQDRGAAGRQSGAAFADSLRSAAREDLAARVKEQLRRGTPSIELNPATGTNEGSAGLPSDANTIVVGVWMLQPGEDMIVARRLREVLYERRA